jgi:hypothetical protein
LDATATASSHFLIDSACNLPTADGSHMIANIGARTSALPDIWRDYHSAGYHLVNTVSSAKLTKWTEKLNATKIFAEAMTEFLYTDAEHLA